MLVNFLTCDDTLKRIGKQYATNIVTFLRNHVFPHEDKFAAFHYHGIRSFDEYSNTPLEGTNNAVKHCTLGVKGNMPLHHSSVNMVQQDSDKLLAKKMDLHSEMHKQRLCNLDSEDGKYISKRAYGQLVQQCEAAQNYASIRTSKTTWSVMYSLDENKQSNSRVIPVFSRIRHVTWNTNLTLSCDCGYTSRWGMPCRHMAHVAEFYTTTKYSFTHHDVDIRWWSINSQLTVVSEPSQLTDEELNIRYHLNQIRDVQTFPKIDVIEDFVRLKYACGNKSIQKFIKASLDSARTFFNRNNSIILNYPETESKGTVEAFTMGITEIIYVMDDSDCDGQQSNR